MDLRSHYETQRKYTENRSHSGPVKAEKRPKWQKSWVFHHIDATRTAFTDTERNIMKNNDLGTFLEKFQ